MGCREKETLKCVFTIPRLTSSSDRVPGPDRTPLSSSQLSETQPQGQKSVETPTKRQRQNARKREEQKAGKADAEAERLAVLAKHKKALEKERMAEQYKTPGSGKAPSGGMKATVDDRGKLVWE